jgi:hypothetical protein
MKACLLFRINRQRNRKALVSQEKLRAHTHSKKKGKKLKKNAGVFSKQLATPTSSTFSYGLLLRIMNFIRKETSNRPTLRTENSKHTIAMFKSPYLFFDVSTCHPYSTCTHWDEYQQSVRLRLLVRFQWMSRYSLVCRNRTRRLYAYTPCTEGDY